MNNNQDLTEETETRYKEIQELPGVGPATAEKLKKLGYTTIESLATASLKELTNALGDKTAYTIITEARKTLISIPLKGTRRDVRQQFTPKRDTAS